MPPLTWEVTDYQMGVDRGAFYGESIPGVAWNGLVSVEEAPVVNEVKSLYLDGVNYLNVLTGRYFVANVSAFSAPKAFLEAAGTKPVVPGVKLTQQSKSRFGFCYRVLREIGYDLHLVYNCLATMSGKDNQTISDATEPNTLTWEFNATPVDVAGVFKSTAHFIVDSERTDPSALNDLENMLYGTPSITPAFPSISELLALFGDFGG